MFILTMILLEPRHDDFFIAHHFRVSIPLTWLVLLLVRKFVALPVSNDVWRWLHYATRVGRAAGILLSLSGLRLMIQFNW